LGIIKIIKLILLKFPNDIKFKKESMWAISNICVGSVEQAVHIYNEPFFFESMKNIVEGDDVYALKKETYYALSNLVRTDEVNIRTFALQGSTLDVLFKLKTDEENGLPLILELILDFFENALFLELVFNYI
jgi:hypothetical protein